MYRKFIHKRRSHGPKRHGNSRSNIKYVPKGELIAAIRNNQAQAPAAATDEYTPETAHLTDFPLHETLKANIRAKGYDAPTPIQDRTIPAILDGRDVIGTANTGTGKTAAFLIPMLEKITRDRNQRLLVIAPTRELAVQIRDELKSLAHGLSVRSAMLIGGAGEWRQQQDLKSEPHVVVATPGRLKDFIQSRHIRLSGFRNVVLDEAYRMVDIGFINDIKYFISLLPKARQSLCFSATISDKVQDVLTQFIHNPVRVSVKKREMTGTVRQEIIEVADKNRKLDMLQDLLNRAGYEKVLVFGRTKWGVQRLCEQLAKRGFKTTAIHGNRNQNQRQRALTQFANGDIQVLLATDVASRGLDIPDVTHVINYELPETVEDYIHRIGRTGRAEKQGTAITFI